MANSLKWLYLSILALMAAIFGLVHHYFVTGGVWWQCSDFWHHEPLIAMAFVGWAVLLVVYLVERNRIKERQ